MDYRQLKYFLAVCSTSNMTAAASVENVSEQALSKAIRNLERELGAKLFARVPRGVEMTREGLELQAEAVAYVRRHDELLERFSAGGAAVLVLTLRWQPARLRYGFGKTFLRNLFFNDPISTSTCPSFPKTFITIPQTGGRSISSWEPGRGAARRYFTPVGRCGWQ